MQNRRGITYVIPLLLCTFTNVWLNDELLTYIDVSFKYYAGLSSLGVPGHTQIWADQLTLFETRGTDYAHLITTSTPGFSDLLMALQKDDFDQIYLNIGLKTKNVEQ